MSDTSNPQESPAPSSLREQITDKFSPYYARPLSGTMITNIVEQIEAYVTTYIESAEIDARIDEYQDHFPHRRIKKSVWAVTEKDIADRIASLQAQKAVLDKEGVQDGK